MLIILQPLLAIEDVFLLVNRRQLSFM